MCAIQAPTARAPLQLLCAAQAARHYYEGVQGPAWKDREDEQREAQRLGRLPTRHTWRPGAAVRKIWHLVVNAMALVEELARQEGCSNMDAARLVDQRLAQQVGTWGFGGCAMGAGVTATGGGSGGGGGRGLRGLQHSNWLLVFTVAMPYHARRRARRRRTLPAWAARRTRRRCASCWGFRQSPRPMADRVPDYTIHSCHQSQLWPRGSRSHCFLPPVLPSAPAPTASNIDAIVVLLQHANETAQ